MAINGKRTMGFKAIIRWEVHQRWVVRPHWWSKGGVNHQKGKGKPMVVCKATLSIDHSAGFARPNQKTKGGRAPTVGRKATVS